MRRNLDDVLANDPSGNEDIFCVSAIVEDQVFTQVCFVLHTEEAFVAGGRIGRHDTHARPEAIPDPFTSRVYDTRQFMAESGGGHTHASMIALLPYLEVCSGAQRRVAPDHQSARSWGR